MAVVTGGNKGIGLGVAKAYAREGASVTIRGRDGKTLAAAAEEIGRGTLAIKSDAGKISDIENAMAAIRERFGRIDALFVNAGAGKFTPLEEVTESFFDDTFNVNVKGLLFTVQKAVPLMRSGSAVVLNASINGQMAMPNTTVYAASKAAVISLAKTLSIELVERGIRVNSISPGPIESTFLSRELSSEELQQTKRLDRFSCPDETLRSAGRHRRRSTLSHLTRIGLRNRRRFDYRRRDENAELVTQRD